MSEFVFVLGAGASRFAGAPLMGDFLERAETLFGSSLEYKQVAKAISGLQSAHSKAHLDLYSLESVFGAFEMARLVGTRLPGFDTDEALLKLIGAMKTVISTTLEDSIKFPISEYHVRPIPEYQQFVDILIRLNNGAQGGYRCSVITFNYDLVMDFTMAAAQRGYDYCLSNAQPVHMPLLKLHGSINWSSCTKCNAIVPCEFGKYLGPMQTFQSPAFVHLKTSELSRSRHCGEPIEAMPVIVPPTWNKTDYNRSLAPVWRRAARELSDAENIIVIGYSLPETDAFFRYLYTLGSIGERLIKRFCLFDPDPNGAVRARFENLLGKAVEKRFRFRPLEFPCLPKRHPNRVS
jgi:hypothetical protein